MQSAYTINNNLNYKKTITETFIIYFKYSSDKLVNLTT